MAELWTSLGQNRIDVPLFNEHREHLVVISHHRKYAHAHVKAAMRQLVKLSEDLSDLRHQVVQPVLIGGDDVMQFKVYLESLGQSVHDWDDFKQHSIQRCVLS